MSSTSLSPIQKEVVRNPIQLIAKWDNGDAEFPVKDSSIVAG